MPLVFLEEKNWGNVGGIKEQRLTWNMKLRRKLVLENL